MDEASELANYLPLSFKTPKEQEYIEFLWDAFETNYKAEKFQFAFLAYHMLTMSFVYFNIWQIKRHLSDDFSKAMIGFDKEMEHELQTATSPFTFWRVNESAVMRFMKLIGCDNAKIGNYAKLVKDRNATAHCNGNVFYSDQVAMDKKVREILRIVDEIQTHSAPVIRKCYHQFLLDGNDPYDREYMDDLDQIREVLIHGNYLSQKDIDLCGDYDILEYEELEMHTNAPGIEALHQSLRTEFASE